MVAFNFLDDDDSGGGDDVGNGDDDYDHDPVERRISAIDNWQSEAGTILGCTGQKLHHFGSQVQVLVD